MSRVREGLYADQGWWKHLVNHFQNTRRLGEVFEAFVHLSACAVSAGQREEEYLQASQRFSSEDLKVFSQAFALLVREMEHKPYEDLFGPVYMEISSHKGKQMTGEFYTPRSICQLMAKMNAPGHLDFPEDRPLTVCEPAGGTGGMILAFVEELVAKGISPLHVQVTHQELMGVSCHCAFINYSLWGIPATVYHMNTLSMKVFASWSTVFWSAATPYVPDGAKMVRALMGLVGNVEGAVEGGAGAVVEDEGLPEGQLFDVEFVQGGGGMVKPRGSMGKKAVLDNLIPLWGASNPE